MSNQIQTFPKKIKNKYIPLWFSNLTNWQIFSWIYIGILIIIVFMKFFGFWIWFVITTRPFVYSQSEISELFVLRSKKETSIPIFWRHLVFGDYAKESLYRSFCKPDNSNKDFINVSKLIIKNNRVSNCEFWEFEKVNSSSNYNADSQFAKFYTESTKQPNFAFGSLLYKCQSLAPQNIVINSTTVIETQDKTQISNPNYNILCLYSQ